MPRRNIICVLVPASLLRVRRLLMHRLYNTVTAALYAAIRYVSEHADHGLLTACFRLGVPLAAAGRRGTSTVDVGEVGRTRLTCLPVIPVIPIYCRSSFDTV